MSLRTERIVEAFLWVAPRLLFAFGVVGCALAFFVIGYALGRP